MSTAYIIIVGNEKGGSGKTTTAMHIVTALLRMGFRVGTLDLDVRQRSFTRYIRNRMQMAQETQVALRVPEHYPFRVSGSDGYPLLAAIGELSTRNDFIVIDCPGSENPLVRMAHTQADTLVTPINDSFVDLGLIADLDTKTSTDAPGVYSEMVLEQRQRRMDSRRLGQDWVVVRNRLSHIGDANKRSLAEKLVQISGALGFRVVAGLSERVIYRQLFLAGLSVLDLREPIFGIMETKSHVAAREEVRDLIRAIRLPGIDAQLLERA